MSRKPEATFRDSVHRHMRNVEVHRQPMGNSAYVGTPDFYYESNDGVLWVEWKFWKVVPPFFNLTTPTKPSHKTKLSALQHAWLKRADGNGVDAFVICGCPNGGVIMDLFDAEQTWSREAFTKRLQDRKFLAAWLEAFVWKPPSHG